MKPGTARRRRAGHRAPALLGLASLAAGVLLLVGLAGAFVVAGGESGRSGPRLAGETALDAGRNSTQRAPRPIRIAIPAIGVNAPIVPLGLDRAGALEVPRDFSETGWWTGGARPGERGPAVIAGHVDSQTGPAVFYRLGDLRRGDAITVERADGSHARFRVTRSAHYPKDRFPTAEVYGPTGTPALRLITCSGTFDRATGHYLDNTVVYAAL